MKKLIYIIITGLSLSLTSCGEVDPNKSVDEGKVEGNIYTSQEIGWTIEIPKGWSVIDKEKSLENNKKGIKAIEETINGRVDFSGLKTLISFQKNQFNTFLSTSEPFALEYEGEWEENNAAVKEIVYSTYINQGIKTDTSATTAENIDGLEFLKYSFTIYGPKDEVILKQIMYSKLINGFVIAVIINYNNDKDRDELLAVFRNSKFRK